MKVVISGYGKMGKAVEAVLQDQGVSYVSTEDVASFDSHIADGSVCIEFTTPQAFKRNYRFIADHFRAAVVGTTGWDDIKAEVVDYFEKKSKTLIYASNFSIGVNIFFKLNQIASEILSQMADYDPFILELHHNQKLDAPSGTAKSIGEIVSKNFGKYPDIQSVRAGYIFGIHELGFESNTDRIILKHEAFSRLGFALGAVKAAQWSEQMTGVHEFKELLEAKFEEILKNRNK